MKSKHVATIIICVFLIGAISGALIQRSFTNPIIQADTTTTMKPAILDSIPRVEDSQPAPENIPDIIIPTVKLTPSDDSSYVSVRPELTTLTGTLSGGLSYKAQISGIMPTLQSLQVSYPERQITKTVTAAYSGWMLSASANTFLYSTGKLNAGAVAVIEASYNTGPLHLALQAGVMTIKPDTYTYNKTTPYLGARITLDILKLR